MTTATGGFMQTGPLHDPRCPYCGRPVLVDGVVGLDGTYHKGCTEPPLFAPTPAPCIPVQPWPSPWWQVQVPYRYTVTCNIP